jgi:hypothetical protein
MASGKPWGTGKQACDGISKGGRWCIMWELLLLVCGVPINRESNIFVLFFELLARLTWLMWMLHNCSHNSRCMISTCHTKTPLWYMTHILHKCGEQFMPIWYWHLTLEELCMLVICCQLERINVGISFHILISVSNVCSITSHLCVNSLCFRCILQP